MKKALVLSLVALLGFCATTWGQYVELPGSGTPATNHALGGAATQSTTAYGRGPENAVDGILVEPGTHTEESALDPWWEVVFADGDQSISEIVLHNRDNCCQDRLSDITVMISDTANMTALTSPLLNPGDALGGPETLDWDVAAANGGAPFIGGIVRVERNGSMVSNEPNVLTLNEVQAFADDALPGVMVRDTNLALGGVATQSTTDFGGAPELANDGNTDGAFSNGSVTHTAGTEVNPYWQVELGALSEIDGISMYNRTDACCGDRLSDIVVDVLANDGSTVVATSGLLNPGNDLMSPPILAVDFTGQEVEGRFVRVTRMADVGAFLSLAEVEIYGAVVPEPTSFVMAALTAIGLCLWTRRRARP